MRLPALSLAIGCLIFATPSNIRAADTKELLEQIRSVQALGEGHAAAQAAVAELSASGPAVLPQVLAAFDDANPLAANWLRGVFEAVADQAISAGTPLPQEELKRFIVDTEHAPAARRLAYEWLLRIDDDLDDELIPGMLHDPSPEFRRDAVQRRIDQAVAINTDEQAGREQARALFQQALSGAIDDDQVQAVVKPLRKLGVEVDLREHFGFLNQWHVIGPFDNTDLGGFDVAYPPERKVDLTATYAGKSENVSWQPIATEDEYGVIDLAESVAPYKGAIMYATTTLTVPEERMVQFRLGTPNAWKLWLNGELLFARDEYHRGMSLDQYRVPATLRPGKNLVLLKVCQNEQDQDWAQRWQFQIRVSDPSGAGIALTPTDVSVSSTP